MPSLTHKMIACPLPKLGRELETAVCCYRRAETICSVLKSDLKRILPRHDDLLFFMHSKASADLLGFFTSFVTNDGIQSEGWKVEGGQQSARRFVTGEFQSRYSL